MSCVPARVGDAARPGPNTSTGSSGPRPPSPCRAPDLATGQTANVRLDRCLWGHLVVGVDAREVGAAPDDPVGAPRGDDLGQSRQVRLTHPLALDQLPVRRRQAPVGRLPDPAPADQEYATAFASARRPACASRPVGKSARAEHARGGGRDLYWHCALDWMPQRAPCQARGRSSRGSVGSPGAGAASNFGPRRYQRSRVVPSAIR